MTSEGYVRSRIEGQLPASPVTINVRDLRAILATLDELREGLRPLLTVCVRVGSTTREDVDAINRARSLLGEGEG